MLQKSQIAMICTIIVVAVASTVLFHYNKKVAQETKKKPEPLKSSLRMLMEH